MAQNNNKRFHSKLMQALKSGEFAITGELEPERTANLDSLMKEARAIEQYVVAANITDNPGSFVRVDPLATSILVNQKTNVEPIFQLTCRDRNRLGLASAILGACSAGIKNLLVLTGDHTSLGDIPQSKPVFDLDSAQLLKLAREIVDEQKVYGHKIKGKKEHPAKLNIGIGINPNTTHPDIELGKIKRKVEMGVDFIQTQVVYGLENTEYFFKELSKFNVPVLVGLFPMKNYKTAYWFNKLVPGVDVPSEIIEDFKRAQDESSSKSEKKESYDDINTMLFKPIIEELKKKNLASGLHITAVGYSRIYPKLLIE